MHIRKTIAGHVIALPAGVYLATVIPRPADSACDVLISERLTGREFQRVRDLSEGAARQFAREFRGDSVVGERLWTVEQE